MHQNVNRSRQCTGVTVMCGQLHAPVEEEFEMAASLCNLEMLMTVWWT